jgi:hypothetical protein
MEAYWGGRFISKEDAAGHHKMKINMTKIFEVGKSR